MNAPLRESAKTEMKISLKDGFNAINNFLSVLFTNLGRNQ